MLYVERLVDKEDVEDPELEAADMEYPEAPASVLEVMEDADGATAELPLAAYMAEVELEGAPLAEDPSRLEAE